jgi:hypothetical protein
MLLFFLSRRIARTFWDTQQLFIFGVNQKTMMNKNKALIFLLFILSISLGCKKISGDYRNKYWGDYHFLYECYQYDSGGQIGPMVHAGACDGKIYYDKKEGDHNIIIKLNDSNSLITGEITEEVGLSLCNELGLGYFVDTDIYFSLHPNCVDGLFEADQYVIHGTKK